MTLDKKILDMATGEKRLDPDQQRRYLGTFLERVVLLATLAQASQPKLLDQLSSILSTQAETYHPLALKISSQLDTKTEMTYLKTAQDLGIPATIVDEDKACSPYGFVLHSDRLITIDNREISHHYPNLFTETATPTSPKKSFWKQLF